MIDLSWKDSQSAQGSTKIKKNFGAVKEHIQMFASHLNQIPYMLYSSSWIIEVSYDSMIKQRPLALCLDDFFSFSANPRAVISGFFEMASFSSFL